MMSKWFKFLAILSFFTLYVTAQPIADPNGGQGPAYPRPPVQPVPRHTLKTIKPPKPSDHPSEPHGFPPKPSGFPPKPPGPGPHHWFNSSIPIPTPSTTESTTAFPLSAIAAGPSPSLAGLWEQCGGTTYSGPTVCIPGAHCSTQDAYYAQCVTDAPVPGHQTLWGQCGGKHWKGHQKCQHGFECATQNDWFAQCRLPKTYTHM